ncbi:YceD family protein [Chitiniphilus purpureus]|uniref:Large ribosomal RNA subunit accumulation protein YceD n=1 Tax=Chitiniphilus purpureus TaxID=2981137 RepID=A0ABY6DLL6_9NEIS|nr:YceD family protein [Chitiniphilus sp. CD1]UXY14927.1 YceD family protein [Chitiniphilus sp. CD1]
MPVIDSAEFARQARSLAGEVTLAALGRLHDRLADTTGSLSWQIAGETDRYQRPVLRLRVSGEVNLVCQRCLKPMAWPLALETTLTQFHDEALLDEAEAHDEDLEGMLADPALDVARLVEDEVLLAIPFAPRHDACAGVAKAQGAEKPNPFAVLATLKTRKAED